MKSTNLSSHWLRRIRTPNEEKISGRKEAENEKLKKRSRKRETE